MTSVEHQQLVEFLGRQFTEIDRRFDEVDLRFTELRQEMRGHFDEIYRRFERLEQEYHAITWPLRRIEARLADRSGRREILEREPRRAEAARGYAPIADRGNRAAPRTLERPAAPATRRSLQGHPHSADHRQKGQGARRGLTTPLLSTYHPRMDASAPPALGRLVARATKDPDVLAVLLFGSRARGDASPNADFDVCLVLWGAPRSDLDRAEKRLAYLAEGDLDVAVFQSLPLHIRSRVLKEGTILYARDEEALYAVAIRTARAWEGFRHIHRQYLDEILRD